MLGRTTRYLGSALIALGIAKDACSLTTKKFDFVVGVDGDFKAAVAAAAKKASSAYRFHIFFPDGEYNIGALTGDSNQKSTFTTANVSFIGQSADKTVVYNRSVQEQIGITATLYLNNADDMYLQDLTIMNKANYGNTASYAGTGRHVAVQEQSDRLIYKNVKLLSTQDTYYTKGSRTYWEGGQIDGTTDFICGGGDIFFNKVTLNELKDGSPITASSPASSNSWGYVFKNCTINATKSGYLLGRSWGEARVVFLNTTMKQLPAAAGWGDPMNNVPKVFAEYKSVDGSGNAVDLSKRRTSYTKDNATVSLKPVLTDAEAAKYTLSNVLGGTDNWKPDALAAQVAAPVVSLSGNTLKWNADDAALCWVVFRNGKYLGNVATNSYDVSAVAKGDDLAVRAANAMGGLGAISNSVKAGSSVGVLPSAPAGAIRMVSQRNRTLVVEGFSGAALDLQILDASGKLLQSARLPASDEARNVDLSSLSLRSGVYLAKIVPQSGTPQVARIHLVD